MVFQEVDGIVSFLWNICVHIVMKNLTELSLSWNFHSSTLAHCIKCHLCCEICLCLQPNQTAYYHILMTHRFIIVTAYYWCACWRFHDTVGYIFYNVRMLWWPLERSMLVNLFNVNLFLSTSQKLFIGWGCRAAIMCDLEKSERHIFRSESKLHAHIILCARISVVLNNTRRN